MAQGEKLHALTVRIPEEMFKDLKVAAAVDGVTVSAIVRNLLSEYLVDKKKENADESDD